MSGANKYPDPELLECICPLGSGQECMAHGQAEISELQRQLQVAKDALALIAAEKWCQECAMFTVAAAALAEIEGKS